MYLGSGRTSRSYGYGVGKNARMHLCFTIFLTSPAEEQSEEYYLFIYFNCLLYIYCSPIFCSGCRTARDRCSQARAQRQVSCRLRMTTSKLAAVFQGSTLCARNTLTPASACPPAPDLGFSPRSHRGTRNMFQDTDVQVCLHNLAHRCRCARHV